MHTCACCGYIVRTEQGDPCPVCDWNRDEYQEKNPDIAVGPNGISLREAQANFVVFGASYHGYAELCGESEPLDKRTAQYVKDANWQPLPSLERDKE